MFSHKPIQLTNVTIAFSEKICFENFTTTIHYGDHIALIGDNGSGKSTLLSLLAGKRIPHEGNIIIPDDAIIGYLPQTIHLNEEKTVWNIVTQNIADTLVELQRFEELTHHAKLLSFLYSCNGTAITTSHNIELLHV